ncbi:ABC transporter ATP-binding protein [Alteribacillus sp. YIM 98480]|uniref:ABC transporter ATP-binding protein n=1 Tax=Alteribacillus sp. YIM 98480 TaxID=2606599 RepID=UPI00131DDF53|nr:betaine/proline/choline family ABC transporter ATP-binding protein [Alteribacillus sp. YIM 98480]
MIKFEDVKKVFSDGFEALKNINFDVKEGELVTLIGPSGCGKTTTMKMINRLLEPTDGKIYIDGKDISKMNPVTLRRNTGYVIQQIGLFPHMTIAENIALIPKLKGWEKQKYEKRIDELLDLVGLDPSVFRERYPAELSGGQQQRVGVIRALAAEPPVILMDEPFSALDPITRDQLQDELVRLQDEIKKTIVFVTHDMDEAMKIASKIAIMKDGEIVQFEEPERLLRYPKNDFVKDFIGEERLTQDDAPTAEKLMMKKLVTSKPTRGMAEAQTFMKRYAVDTLLITDKDKFLGVVSFDDVETHYDEEDKKVQDILNDEVPTVSPDTAYTDIAEIFATAKVQSIPVLTDDKLVGLITRSSMLRGLAGMKQKPYEKEEIPQ